MVLAYGPQYGEPVNDVSVLVIVIVIVDTNVILLLLLMINLKSHFYYVLFWFLI